MLNQLLDKKCLSDEEYEIYSRHILLDSVGITGQIRIKNAKVLCIGAGALASSSLLYLTAAGIGSIGIIDSDKVEKSNLQRQILYTYENLEESKVSAAKYRLKALNPFCNVDIYHEKLGYENALHIILPYDIILDSTDNFETRYVIIKLCHQLHKIHIYGAVQGFEGQISVFNYKNGPNYCDLYPRFVNEGIMSCKEHGILGFLPGVVGILQAIETIKIVTGIGSILSGYLLIYNALSMSLKKVKIRRFHLKSNSGFCTKKTQQTNSGVAYISQEELKKILENRAISVLLIDVRNHNEFMDSHIELSNNVPLQKMKNVKTIKYLKLGSSTRNLIIYCDNESRSLAAFHILEKYDIKSCVLSGGINAWIK